MGMIVVWVLVFGAIIAFLFILFIDVAHDNKERDNKERDNNSYIYRTKQEFHNAIWDYLIKHDRQDFTAQDIADALGVSIKCVNGWITSFQKKGYVIREAVTINGNTVKYIRLADGVKQWYGKESFQLEQELKNDFVYNALLNAEQPITVTDLIARGGLESLANESGIVTVQRVSAILKRLVDNKLVYSYIHKNRVYFAIDTSYFYLLNKKIK